jgi:hypothetical protein
MGRARASTIRLAVAAASLAGVLALAPALDRAHGDPGGDASASAKKRATAPKGKKQPPRGNRRPAKPKKPALVCKRVKRKKPVRAGEKKPPRVKCRRRRPKLPSREFFGVQPFEPISTGEAAALRSARVGTLRIALGWPRVERVPGERNWAYSDYQFNLAAREGIRVFPVLVGTALQPGNYGGPPLRSYRAVSGWATFVADAARRYGPGGVFWQLNPQLPYMPVREWQVWNEQSSVHGWDRLPNAGEYASLVRSTSEALRAVDPETRVVLGGILPHRRDPSGIPMRQFLRDIYRQPDIKRHFDAVALHPYSPRPRKVLEFAQKLRKVMVRNRDRKTELIISEIGWSTGGTQGGELATTEAEQARRLRKSYRMLIRHRRALGLKRIVWLFLRDYAGGSDYWVYRMGLFDTRKVAKPAWSALAAVAGGKPATVGDDPPARALPPPPAPPAPPPNEQPCFLIIFC